MVMQAVCGERWHESSVKYDLASSSWKTHRCLWEEDLPESSVILPEWGMMRGGVVLERSMSALPTSENDSGLLPTPRCAMASIYPESKETFDARGKDARRTLPLALGGIPNPDFIEWLMGWPVGWSNVSKRVETAKFREWLRSHGSYWKAGEKSDESPERQEENAEAMASPPLTPNDADHE